MATATVTVNQPATLETVADLVEALGGIPLHRIRVRPPVGTATERDVLAARELPERLLCELVDGILVEKAMGANESLLAAVIIQYVGIFVEQHDLGVVLGADGTLRLMPGLVRIPDVSFISWDRLPHHAMPEDPIPNLVPDLAVEVLSEGNTPKEIKRKLQEYFETGVRLVWLVQPKTQTAEIYTSPTKKRKIGKDQALDGGDVLPGFTLPLKQLFARTKRRRGSR